MCLLRGGRRGGVSFNFHFALIINVCYLSMQAEAERKIFQVVFETSQTASEKFERFIAT